MSSVDRGSVDVLVLFDLSAAFDTTDQGIYRLTHIFGVNGAAFQGFRSYLAGRQRGSFALEPECTMYITPLGNIVREFGLY